MLSQAYQRPTQCIQEIVVLCKIYPRERFGTGNYIFIQLLYVMLHDLLIFKICSRLLGI